MPALPLLLLSLATALPLVATADDHEPPRPPLTRHQLDAHFARSAAAHPDLVTRFTLGTTLAGHPIEGLVLAAGEAPLVDRAGLLVIGGLDGRRPGDAAVVVALAERLLALPADELATALDGKALVLVPRVNHDGTGALLGEQGPVHERRGNSRSDDADRDGRRDEDAGNDLDGNGVITSMRIPDPEGEWVLDEHDPRALRKAKRSEGERGTHRVAIEGLDDDGDGEANEDGGSGVALDRNFAHGWPEHTAEGGAYPLSEPEAKALAVFLHAHPGLQGVLVVGDQDTLVSLPGEAKKVDRGGWRNAIRSPLDGLLKEDVATLKEFQRRFNDALKSEEEDAEADENEDDADDADSDINAEAEDHAEGDADDEDGAEDDDGEDEAESHAEGEGGSDDEDESDADSEDDDAKDSKDAGPKKHKVKAGSLVDGSFLAWAYHQEGRWPLAVKAWEPPTKFPKDKDAKSDDAKSDKGKKGGGKPGKQKKDEPTNDADSPVPAAVLAWLDDEREGNGFVPWTAFDHPEHGAVEIGGLRPGLLLDPPSDAADALADRLAPWLMDLLAALPSVAFESLKVERKADGLYTLSVALVNSGVLPTTSKLASETNTLRPVRVRLHLPDGAQRLQGPEQVLVDYLEGAGGRQEMRWVIAAPARTTLRLSADADTTPDVELEIELP